MGSTQARHLRELDTMSKDLIVMMTGDNEEDVVVDYDIRLPDAVAEHLRRSEELRATSAEAQAAAAAEVAVPHGSCTNREWRCATWAKSSACRTSERTNS